MYSAVKYALTAGVIIVASIQPGADAAMSPYAPPVESLQVTLLSPFPEAISGQFQIGEIPSLGLPSAFSVAPPAAMIAPETVKLTVAPTVTEIAPATVEQTVVPGVDTPMGKLDEALPLPEAPEEAPGEASIMPREAPFHATPGEVTSGRRAARLGSYANPLQIKFAGPSGAPFAHTRFCIKYPDECRVRKMLFRGGPIELTAERRQELARVNTEVNRSIVATAMNEPVAQEQWLISPKFGDCNDFAVTKRHKLIALGWPARALLLAEVVVPWGEHHLVLVVRTNQGDLVADNLNADIRNWTKTPYEWVRVESPVNPMFWSKIKAPRPDLVALATTPGGQQ